MGIGRRGTQIDGENKRRWDQSPGAQLESLQDSLGSVLPSSGLAWGGRESSLSRNKSCPDPGFPRRAPAPAEMAPWELRKLSRPPLYPLLHFFLLACGFRPQNVGTVCCPRSPVPLTLCHLTSLCFGSWSAVPWLLFKVPFPETGQDSDPKGEGSGNHRHGTCGHWAPV